MSVRPTRSPSTVTSVRSPRRRCGNSREVGASTSTASSAPSRGGNACLNRPRLPTRAAIENHQDCCQTAEEEYIMQYGVLRARPDHAKREDGAATPHLQIRALDTAGQPWRVAVNVQSDDGS